jgi:hypothetical protein
MIRYNFDDNLAAAFVERLPGTRLNVLTLTAEGRAMMDVLYEAMITGDVSPFQREQTERILEAKKYRASQAKFLKNLDQRMIFPIRNIGLTRMASATFHAELLPNGNVKVRYTSVKVTQFDMFKKDLETLPSWSKLAEGIELDPEQIVAVRIYDEEGVSEDPIDIPALALIDYSNQIQNKTISTAATAFFLGLTLGAGALGGGVLRGLHAGVARGEVSKAYLWAMRGVIWADRIAWGIAAGAMIINDHRAWIVKEFPTAGPVLLDAVDTANRVAGYYGWGRLTVGTLRYLGSKMRSAVDSWRAARAEAAKRTDLSAAEQMRIRAVEDEADTLVAEFTYAEEQAAGGAAKTAATPQKPNVGGGKTGSDTDIPAAVIPTPPVTPVRPPTAPPVASAAVKPAPPMTPVRPPTVPPAPAKPAPPAGPRTRWGRLKWQFFQRWVDLKMRGVDLSGTLPKNIGPGGPSVAAQSTAAATAKATPSPAAPTPALPPQTPARPQVVGPPKVTPSAPSRPSTVTPVSPATTGRTVGTPASVPKQVRTPTMVPLHSSYTPRSEEEFSAGAHLGRGRGAYGDRGRGARPFYAKDPWARPGGRQPSQGGEPRPSAPPSRGTEFEEDVQTIPNAAPLEASPEAQEPPRGSVTPAGDDTVQVVDTVPGEVPGPLTQGEIARAAPEPEATGGGNGDELILGFRSRAEFERAVMEKLSTVHRGRPPGWERVIEALERHTAPRGWERVIESLGEKVNPAGILDKTEKVMDILQNPKFWAEVLGDAWDLVKARKATDINHALILMAEATGLLIDEVRRGYLAHEFFPEVVTKKALWVDEVLAILYHGKMIHLLQDLVVNKGLRGPHASAEYRQQLRELVGMVERYERKGAKLLDSQFTKLPDNRTDLPNITFTSHKNEARVTVYEVRMQVGDYVWRFTYDLLYWFDTERGETPEVLKTRGRLPQPELVRWLLNELGIDLK